MGRLHDPGRGWRRGRHEVGPHRWIQVEPLSRLRAAVCAVDASATSAHVLEPFVMRRALFSRFRLREYVTTEASPLAYACFDNADIERTPDDTTGFGRTLVVGAVMEWYEFANQTDFGTSAAVSCQLLGAEFSPLLAG